MGRAETEKMAVPLREASVLSQPPGLSRVLDAPRGL